MVASGEESLRHTRQIAQYGIHLIRRLGCPLQALADDSIHDGTSPTTAQAVVV